MTKDSEHNYSLDQPEPLTDNQIKLLQDFIDDRPAGKYDAMDLIPEGYRQYFATPTKHGKQFAKAVEGHRLSGIELLGTASNNHKRYKIERN